MSQRKPKPGGRSVTAEIRRMLDAREAKGIKTYGRSLETFNGRDAHQDELEEFIDGFQYRVQARMEAQALSARLIEARAILRLALKEISTYGQPDNFDWPEMAAEFLRSTGGKQC